MTTVCYACICDFHEFCENTGEADCCCDSSAVSFISPEPTGSLSISQLLESLDSIPDDDLPPLYSSASTSVAAGRKKAARSSPIPVGTACEWAGLRYAGGGVLPIIGCDPASEHLAKARHHGPDKSTLNNERGVNLHVICSRCHNRWHTLNDDYYGVRTQEEYLPKSEYLSSVQPHDPNTKASPEDLIQNIEFWNNRKLKKVKDEE